MSKNHFHGPNKLLLIIKHKWDFPCVYPTNEITIFVCQMESDVKFSQHFYMARNRLSVRLMMVKPLECVVLIEFLGKFNHFSMRTQVFFFLYLLCRLLNRFIHYALKIWKSCVHFSLLIRAFLITFTWFIDYISSEWMRKAICFRHTQRTDTAAVNSNYEVNWCDLL